MSKINAFPIYVQRYYDGCPQNVMIGTKECPAITCGFTYKIEDDGFTAYYPPGTGRARPGVMTPEYFRSKYGEDCRINIQIGGVFFRDISIPHVDEIVWTDNTEEEAHVRVTWKRKNI